METCKCKNELPVKLFKLVDYIKGPQLVDINRIINVTSCVQYNKNTAMPSIRLELRDAKEGFYIAFGSAKEREEAVNNILKRNNAK